MTHLAEMPVRWEGLIVTFAFDAVGGRTEVTEVTIRREDGGAVPVACRPPLARLAAQALRELRVHWAPQILRLRPSETAVAAATVLLDAPGPRRGRPPLYGPQHWAEVGSVYSSGGLGAVAARWCVSRSTAWKWAQRLT